MKEKSYLCIDLKSFYASVECVERGLDPMTTNLVVADPERTDKTICLAVSPSLKELGVKNRCRVFEIPTGINYIMAEPKMQKYIDYAAKIYGLYLQYIAPEDIHVYSIDEAFLDVTPYLNLYHLSAIDMASRLMEEISHKVGIRATCGIGTNLYLAKVALDIQAKHSPDFIAYLDETLYQKSLWDHQPITDFWRIGRGTAHKLAKFGIHTMGQIAEISEREEEFFYRRFGIDAELLIDHAWGREPTTIADIKSYRPKANSLSSGQVLMRDYSFEEGRIIVKEMMDLLCLDMVDRHLVTSSVSLCVDYSHTVDAKPAKGTASVHIETNSDTILLPAIESLYERIMDRQLPIRRVILSCNQVVSDVGCQQLTLYDSAVTHDALQRDRKRQEAVLAMNARYGKNAVLKGMDLQAAATTRERNQQIGGHKSGA